MFVSKPVARSLYLALASAVLLCFAAPPSAHAWGTEGHRFINRTAAVNLPADMPAFMLTAEAANEIEYLGPEPDRWRSPAEPELNAAQSPEHQIDLERAEPFAPLPERRFDFYAKVYAAGQKPDAIGLLPWQADEVWERLKNAMRQYRTLAAAKQDTKPVEADILFYTGWLGHYVADGSQPLHVTIQYNGWTGPNPNGYTTSNKIHYQFESAFVSANLPALDVKSKITPAKVIKGDMFQAYMAYLHDSFSNVDKLYQLEKAGGFTGAGSAESRDFVAARLAAGVNMLRDMIYTAWVKSADPVNDPYAAK